MKLVIDMISKAPVIKFIWGRTASGNEAIIQNKWSSSGNRGSILHLTILFPPHSSPHPLPTPSKSTVHWDAVRHHMPAPCLPSARSTLSRGEKPHVWAARTSSQVGHVKLQVEQSMCTVLAHLQGRVRVSYLKLRWSYMYCPIFQNCPHFNL